MKAIITGGCGFIGYNLCKALLDHDIGWNIMVIDDLSSGKPWNKWDGITYIESPIQESLNEYPRETAIEYYARCHEPDVIFHLAAIPRVSYSVEFPFETTAANMMGTMGVFEAARKSKKKVRVVYTSSSSIYGGADELPTPVNCPSNSQSPYALQKWQGEEWGRMYASLYDLDIVSLRYFNVFGMASYYGGAYSTVLSAWLYSLYVDPATRPFLEGDGTQSRDFCYVDNVTQANILAALSEKDFHGEAFNIAQGSSHSLLDCKELLESISGKILDLEYKPERIGDVKHTLADISAAKNILGYEPTTNFEDQVRVMAKWYEKSYRKN